MTFSVVSLLLLGTFGATSAASESTAVPYPAPKEWSHAWPYDYSNGVFVDRQVKVVLKSSALSGEGREAVDPVVNEILGRYQALLRNKVSANDRFRGGYAASLPVLSTVVVEIRHTSNAELGIETDESYSLSCTLVPGGGGAAAVVTANNVYGARHGLESFAQFVDTPSGVISGVNKTTGIQVEDAPRYAYRGVMIDTGRHFLSLATIRHIINGMGYVLHV